MDALATVARLQALAAAPKPWLATIYLPDNTIRTIRQPREAMARAWGERHEKNHGVPFTVDYSPEAAS